jgi:hypothetical protein
MSKAKDFITHPLLAPVVDTVSSIGRFIGGSVSGFVEKFQDGYDDDRDDDVPKRLGEGWKSLLDMDGDNFWTDMGPVLGVIAGGLGGLFAGVALAAAAATTSAAIWTGVLAIPALVTVGVVVGPIAIVAATMVGAAAISPVLAGVPGLLKGCGRFISHLINPKARGAEKTAEVFAEAGGTERDRSATAFKNKREVFMAEAKKLSPKERQELIKDIRQDFDGDFREAICKPVPAPAIAA